MEALKVSFFCFLLGLSLGGARGCGGKLASPARSSKAVLVRGEDQVASLPKRPAAKATSFAAVEEKRRFRGEASFRIQDSFQEPELIPPSSGLCGPARVIPLVEKPKGESLKVVKGKEEKVV